jgi:hypothetical protein
LNRLLAAILSIALPLSANAFQDQIQYLPGVKITATRSATRLCGVDFVIAVSDADQHLVKIDYSYFGTFKDNPSAPDVPLYLEKGRRSQTISVSVGRATLHGNLARIAAPEFPNGSLLCRETWDFHYVSNANNASQEHRNDADAAEQRRQAKLDGAARRRAEEAERRRRAAQAEVNRVAAQAKAARDQLADYRRAHPENARCIINGPADIARCEQAKAREREQRLKLEAEARDAERRAEAARIAAANQEAQFKASQELYERQVSNPCAVAADQAQRMPALMQQHAAPTRQNDEAKAQLRQSQAGLDAACAASK